MKDRTSQGIVLHIIGSLMMMTLSGLLAVESFTEFSGMSCLSGLMIFLLGLLGINSLLAGNIGLLLGSRKSGNLFLTVLAAVLYALSPAILITGVFIPFPLGVAVISLGLFTAMVSLPLPHLRLGGIWPALVAILIAGLAAVYLLLWIVFVSVSVFMPILFIFIAIFFLMNAIAAAVSFFSHRRKIRIQPVEEESFPKGMGVPSPKDLSTLRTVRKQPPPSPSQVVGSREDGRVKFPFTDLPGMEPFAFGKEVKAEFPNQPAKASPLSSGFRVVAAEVEEPEKPDEIPKKTAPGREKRSVYYRKPPSVEELFRDLDISEDEGRKSREDRPPPDKESDEARIISDEIDLDLDDIFIDGEDLYEILRIPRFSNMQNVRKAYRKRAMMYHPDLNPGIGPEYERMLQEEMRKINLAKEILLSADRKSLYDSALRDLT
jgi:hypothetical protein